jgi:hypothetical protein
VETRESEREAWERGKGEWEDMNGRVRRKVNGVQRAVRKERNVYEAIQEQRNWEEGNRVREGKRPHYCYKEGRRGVSATCRMCRVEREGGRKPVPSCARPVGNMMSVWTETPRVQKVREGVRERRLRNHPLDCPICDQGGECDLQEQTREYGSESSRRMERKRGVEDKSRGGHVKMVMTRCIHCTRCVRYGKQVGKRGRGMRGRGKAAEIGRYTEEASRQSVYDGNTYHRVGNRVDRCPVGARTSEAGKFKVRPWEMKMVETVDRRDSVGAPLARKYVRGERERVRPKRGERGERLGDKTRYGYDGRENGRRRERQRSGRKGEGKERRQRKEGRERSSRKGRGLEEERVRGARKREGVGKRGGEESEKVVEKRGERREGAKRVVGTGVDRERREERKREERRGEREREARGVGKRAERRRHVGERGREREATGEERGKGSRRTRGSRRGYERPLVRRKRAGVEYGLGLGGGEEKTVGVGRGRRQGRVGGKNEESRARRKERKVRRGGGRWNRQDGSGWLKRKGKRSKGREEMGKKGGNVGVSVRQHRTNTQGRRGRGLK